MGGGGEHERFEICNFGNFLGEEILASSFGVSTVVLRYCH